MPDLEQYKKDVGTDYDANEEVRQRCNEDMRFIGVDGGMWEGFLEETYSEENKRVMLEIDITSEDVMRFIGEWTLNRANVNFTPDDKSTTEEEAELLSGIYRSDFKDNDGQLSQDLAVFETAISGFGAFEMTPKFVDEEDPENENQEIVWTPINNAFNHVMFDENAVRVDKADANRVTKLTTFSRDAFEDKYPGKEPSDAYVPEKTHFEWSTRDVIWVATRYEIRVESTDIQVWENIELGQVKAFKEEDDMAEELKGLGWNKVRERKMDLKTVWQSVFTGLEFLQEPKKIAGKFLPIIPMYGYRTYVDNKEHTHGLVRKKKDPQRTFNMGISKMAEASASSGESLPIFTRKQIEKLEAEWVDQSAAYRVINDIMDGNGNPIVSGPVGYTPVNQLDPNTMAAMEIVSNVMQRQTGNAPQDSVNPVASGKAIDALENRQNMSTQPIKDNIQQSIKHSGKVYRSMAGDVYTRTQMKKVLGLNGQVKLEQLNSMSLDPSGNPIMINDLSKGRFGVDVELTPQYESQKRATVESIERVIEKLPENSQYFAPVLAMWMENITGIGLKPLKEFNRKLMLRQGLVEPDNDEEIQLLEQLSQQTDPQDELAAAATEQQRAEAQNLLASSKNKEADTKKKEVETMKIRSEIGLSIIDRRMEQFNNVVSVQ